MLMALAVGAADHPTGLDKAVTPEQLAFFEKKIRPILVQHCYECHSAAAEKSKGGLLVDTREGLRAGGDSGHAVVPGSLSESLLLTAIRWQDKDLQMPPEKNGGKLPDEVVADFERWILMGAPDSRDGKAANVQTKIDLEKGREFWAYQPPKKAAPPAVKDSAWPRSDIDRFLLEKLEGKGLKPVGDADPRTLIRRVYFDLIGLPPTPEEVEAFVKACEAAGDSANRKPQSALTEVVDRLLASPQFGERWGRHWLDVARYAESSGKEANITFPHAWRYRDYVIDSFNADKPFDQFIQEQIAGDLLPAKDEEQRAGLIVATGFLALGPKSLNENNPRQFAMDVVDEQIDTWSQAILATTIACARCHDHKFDPIPQKEYYSLAGIFLSTETHYGTIQQQGNRRGSSLLPIPLKDEPVDMSKVLTPSERQRLENQLNQLREERSTMFTDLRRSRANSGDQGQLRQRLIRLNDQMARIEARLESVDELGVPRPFAMGVKDRPRPTDARILIRGEVDRPADTVPRGFVSVLSTPEAQGIEFHGSGRLELAGWLTSMDNPLTARVFVNRAWHWLFDRGIVPTVDNFGVMGQKPGHPELLDHLAIRFMEEGWSVKKLVREIVLSRAYQLGSDFDQKNFTADPDNALVWRMSKRRLDAESIRDAMLAVSGQLNLEPPNGSLVARAGDGYVGRGISERAFDYDTGHRSVYLPVVRDLLPDALDLFDFAEPSLVTGARETTTVPAQALYLMNSPFAIQQSERFAARLFAEVPGQRPAERIRRAYELALGRPPTEADVKYAEDFFRQFLVDLRGKSRDPRQLAQAGWTAFCQALFASAEFRYLN
jgi:hypothetical protein